MPDSCSFLFWAPSSMSLHRSIMKVENMLFNAYGQHTPFLSPNHTHREALTVWNRQCFVATVWGETQDGQLPQRDQHGTFTLSLSSHFPPGEASCTQQQGVPPLTPQSTSGHTAGPGPAPLRAESPSLPQGLISVSEVEAKSPGAQCRIQIRIICSLCTFLG